MPSKAKLQYYSLTWYRSHRGEATSFWAYNHGVSNLRQTKKMFCTIKWNFSPKTSPHPSSSLPFPHLLSTLNLSINSIDFPVAADTMSASISLMDHTHYNSALVHPPLFLDNLFSSVIIFSKRFSELLRLQQIRMNIETIL